MITDTNDLKIIIHRVNSLSHLKATPLCYGVEIDVRADGNRIILNHEPFRGGENLEEYLRNYKHSFIIFNIKEAGIEDKVIELAKKYNVKDYFLLDVEFPYLYRAARDGVHSIAIRYSEEESIETVLRYKGMVEWVWIDTNTTLPLDRTITQKLSGFKTCLVCPERWGRPQDIPLYMRKIKELDFKLDAVMTNENYVEQWKQLYFI